MSVGDAIGIYGAFVATIVALIQFQQHRAVRKIFYVRDSDEFSVADGHISFTITNLSNREVEIDFAGVGFGYRPWLTPWKSQFDELIGLDVFILDDNNREVQWLKPLQPGQLVYAGLNRGVAALAKIPNWSRNGVKCGLYIEITHSLAKHRFLQRLK